MATGANFQSVEGTCIMCPRLAGKLCPKCKDARYCGKDCQKLDWRNHKIICESFDHSRPSPFHRRVLLFPGGDTPPRFEWLQSFPLSALGLPGCGEYLDTPKFFGTQNQDLNSNPYNVVQGRIVRRKPEEKLFWFKQPREDPKVPAPTAINHALRAFTRAGACLEDFKGPVIISRAAEYVLKQFTHRDMDMRDARNAADWLSQGARGEVVSVPDQPHNAEVLGTTIESNGQVINQGKPQWSDVLVDGNDIIWTSEGSQIANLLGLPLFFRSARYGKGIVSHQDFENPAITLLHRDIISTKVLAPSPGLPRRLTYYGDHEREAQHEREAFVGTRGYGSSMRVYSGRVVDTCYVVRADGKPLPKEHTEAICSYIADKVEPQLTAAIEGLSENDIVSKRNEILDSITKSSFLDCYEAMRKEKVRHCNMGWRDLPNPYEIKRSDLSQLKDHLPHVRACVPPAPQRIGPPLDFGPTADPEPTYYLF